MSKLFIVRLISKKNHASAELIVVLFSLILLVTEVAFELPDANKISNSHRNRAGVNATIFGLIPTPCSSNFTL
jgi:hypothetical protein